MEKGSVETALGNPIRFGADGAGRAIKAGLPPVVLHAQAYGYIPLETPEQLRQWESDVRTFYGVDVDASGLAGVAAETCSCGCTDDCGML